MPPKGSPKLGGPQRIEKLLGELATVISNKNVEDARLLTPRVLRMVQREDSQVMQHVVARKGLVVSLLNSLRNVADSKCVEDLTETVAHIAGSNTKRAARLAKFHATEAVLRVLSRTSVRQEQLYATLFGILSLLAPHDRRFATNFRLHGGQNVTLNYLKLKKNEPKQCLDPLTVLAHAADNSLTSSALVRANAVQTLLFIVNSHTRVGDAPVQQQAFRVLASLSNNSNNAATTLIQRGLVKKAVEMFTEAAAGPSPPPKQAVSFMNALLSFLKAAASQPSGRDALLACNGPKQLLSAFSTAFPPSNDGDDKSKTEAKLLSRLHVIIRSCLPRFNLPYAVNPIKFELPSTDENSAAQPARPFEADETRADTPPEGNDAAVHFSSLPSSPLPDLNLVPRSSSLSTLSSEHGVSGQDIVLVPPLKAKGEPSKTAPKGSPLRLSLGGGGYPSSTEDLVEFSDSAAEAGTEDDLECPSESDGDRMDGGSDDQNDERDDASVANAPFADEEGGDPACASQVDERSTSPAAVAIGSSCDAHEHVTSARKTSPKSRKAKQSKSQGKVKQSRTARAVRARKKKAEAGLAVTASSLRSSDDASASRGMSFTINLDDPGRDEDDEDFYDQGQAPINLSAEEAALTHAFFPEQTSFTQDDMPMSAPARRVGEMRQSELPLQLIMAESSPEDTNLLESDPNLPRTLLQREVELLDLGTERKPELVYDVNDAALSSPSPNSSARTLSFDSSFESGNLRQVYKVGPTSYHLVASSDINSVGHHQWFFFNVQNFDTSVQYRFSIVNHEKPGSQLSSGMQPVLFDIHRPEQGWRRIGTDIAYFKNDHKRRDGKSRKGSSYYYTATFSVVFPEGASSCYLAYHFPYTYTRLSRVLATLPTKYNSSTFLHHGELCKTLSGHDCPLLTITSLEEDDLAACPLESRPYVVFSARVHPGETNASWMMEGLLTALTENSSRAREWRRSFIFKIVPMLNPDGVIHGSHRCSLSGVDLNRQWKTPSAQLHPPIYSLKALLRALRVKPENDVLLFCDLHGHSRRKNIFLYGCCGREGSAQEELFADILNELAPMFSRKQSKFALEKSKESTARIVAWKELGITHSYTLESTYCGFDNGPLEGQQVSTWHLKTMGEMLARAVPRLLERRRLLVNDRSAVSSETAGSLRASVPVENTDPGSDDDDDDDSGDEA